MLTHDTTVTEGQIYINGRSCYDHSTQVSHDNSNEIAYKTCFEMQNKK